MLGLVVDSKEIFNLILFEDFTGMMLVLLLKIKPFKFDLRPCASKALSSSP